MVSSSKTKRIPGGNLIEFVEKLNDQTSVFRKFDQEGLSAARQAAVLKTAIKNSSSNTINPEGASNGVARGSYRSVEFEVTYSENEGTLVITDARLLAA